jgi:hypothetical protein
MRAWAVNSLLESCANGLLGQSQKVCDVARAAE